MADLSYFHGVKLEESADTPSLLRIKNYGITFFNGTAADADAASFPLNTPTLVTSLAQASQLGDSWLLEALETYFGEGGTYAIVNRVEVGEDDDETQENLIGDAAERTGVYSALRAKALLSYQPRVLVTEGNTGAYIEDGVVSVTVTAGGSGYTSVPTVAFGGSGDAAATAVINKHKVKSLTITNAGDDYATAPTIAIAAPPAGGVQATATATVTDGEITAISITNEGSGYVTVPAVTITGGGGSGAILTAVLAGPVTAINITAAGEEYGSTPSVTVSSGGGTGATAIANLGDVASPFVSALVTVANSPGMRARAYVEGPNSTNAEAVRFRNSINSDRVLVIDPKTLKNVNGVPVQKPVAPVFAGVRARVVSSSDGVSGSVSNKIIRTIDGVARTISYPSDSNYLNENHVNTIINERGGFRTWGSRLATDNLIWAFDSVRATADMINESLEDLYFVYVDRKFTKGNLKMMIEDGNAALRVFKNNDDILGGRVWLSDLNTPTLNAGGKVFLNVEFEPVGIMEQIHITTYRNILYYTLMLDDVRGAIENGPLTLAA